ncbi:MAG: M23 family metallopeptidase, partial [Candidatus Pacebacteria bacterium]|nr:M23 family metallopeptidase [Candidatus Paceibacterota bacterium]
DFFAGSGIENISTGGITVYEVKEGDTLSQIAEDFDVSQNTIRWENKLSGSSIKIGQKLNILPVTGVKHIVKKGDNLSKIANSYDADLDDMLVFNGINKDSILKEGDILFVPNGIIKTVGKTSSSSKTTSVSSNTKAPSGYFIKPAVGRITSPYGSRWGTFHYGVDIGNSRGTSIVASASGKVIKVVNYCKEGNSSCGGRYGNYITIEHPNGMKTKYAHLGSVSVSLGQSVKQGQLIGKMGNTGRSTGPHLHFEVINSNGSTVRPPVY